jgi:hypothetical protein
VLVQEIQGDFQRSLGARLVPFGTMIAVEAVIGWKDVDLNVRVLTADDLPILWRDPWIELTEMQKDWHARLLTSKGNGLAAVVSDRASDAREPRRGEKGKRTAPAISDNADWTGLRCFVNGGINIHQSGIPPDLSSKRASFFDALRSISELHARARSIEECWGDHAKASFGVTVTDLANVSVDPENLLENDEPSDWRVTRINDIRVQLMVIRGTYEDLGRGGELACPGLQASCSGSHADTCSKSSIASRTLRSASADGGGRWKRRTIWHFLPRTPDIVLPRSTH